MSENREGVDWVALAAEGKLFRRDGEHVETLHRIAPPLKRGEVFIDSSGNETWYENGRYLSSSCNDSPYDLMPPGPAPRPWASVDDVRRAVGNVAMSIKHKYWKRWYPVDCLIETGLETQAATYAWGELRDFTYTTAPLPGPHTVGKPCEVVT